MTFNHPSVATHLLGAASTLALIPSFAAAQDVGKSPLQQGAMERLDEVVVTGRSLGDLGTQSLQPVQLLQGDALVHRRQGGLGETLAGLPGVHLDNFGGGASRPVIRGQTTPRIEILSDGANLFDVSSISPDHAITTDPLLLDGIEILRGPAAIRYGGNATYGAVNLIDSRVPKALPIRGLTGAVEARYGTGDHEKGSVGRATAGIGPFAFHIEGARREAEDYRVHAAYGSNRLEDSFAESSSLSVGASWIIPKGYAGVAYTRLDSEYGLPGHSHINAVCHTHGADLHCAAHDEFDDPFGSTDSHTASIKLRSDRADFRADYQDLMPGFQDVRVRLSYTDYRHDEIDGPALFARYTNEVYDGRVELTHKPLLGFTGTFGLQHTRGTFTGLNVNDLHVDGFIPDEGQIGFVPPFEHVTEQTGVFLTERRSFGAIEVEFGARQDWREIELPLPEFVAEVPPELVPEFIDAFGEDWVGYLHDLYSDAYRRDNQPSQHRPFSISAGATWPLAGGYSAALSLARTERAPSIRELYAYGNNLATNSYEVGLANTRRASSQFPEPDTDVLERTKSINLTLRKESGALQFEVGIFHQDVEDYIFARLIETETETGVPANYLLYVAEDATFHGIDGQVTYHVTPASMVTVFGDYVRADLSREPDNLPRISPGRLGARYEWRAGALSGDAEYFRTFEQDHIASYETRTPGFDMLNATISYRLDMGEGRSVDLYLRGTNLTNELAFVHTSFVKDQSPMRGRNFVFGVRHTF